MRLTLARWINVLPKSKVEGSGVLSALGSSRDTDKLTLMDHLQKQKAEAGESWPKNIRIEPAMKKEAFQRVHADVRTRLKKLLRET